jgi:hypothetical protein
VTDESIFAAALAIPDPAGRAAFLDRACAGRPELRREVEELLAAADNPLDRPPAELEQLRRRYAAGPASSPVVQPVEPSAPAVPPVGASQVAALEESLAEARRDIQALKEEVGRLMDDVAAVREEVRTLKQALGE